ncbi:hypothetical protein ZWY2020_028552 [Hordeum vulgare]|nr:hypothetical protein ZWY2020_028552 [Hordeum vulgare]
MAKEEMASPVNLVAGAAESACDIAMGKEGDLAGREHDHRGAPRVAYAVALTGSCLSGTTTMLMPCICYLKIRSRTCRGFEQVVVSYLSRAPLLLAHRLFMDPCCMMHVIEQVPPPSLACRSPHRPDPSLHHQNPPLATDPAHLGSDGCPPQGLARPELQPMQPFPAELLAQATFVSSPGATLAAAAPAAIALGAPPPASPFGIEGRSPTSTPPCSPRPAPVFRLPAAGDGRIRGTPMWIRPSLPSWPRRSPAAKLTSPARTYELSASARAKAEATPEKAGV